MLYLALPTCEIYDWRVARVRLGVCGPALIPPSRWIMFTDPNGLNDRYEVTFEIEREHGPGQKWLPVKSIGPPFDKDKKGSHPKPSGKHRAKEKGIDFKEKTQDSDQGQQY